MRVYVRAFNFSGYSWLSSMILIKVLHYRMHKSSAACLLLIKLYPVKPYHQSKTSLCFDIKHNFLHLVRATLTNAFNIHFIRHDAVIYCTEGGAHSPHCAVLSGCGCWKWLASNRGHSWLHGHAACAARLTKAWLKVSHRWKSASRKEAKDKL